MSATSPFWVSNAGTNTATLYAVDGNTGAVSKLGLTVAIPASPSGQIFNPSLDFPVTMGGATEAARFLFSGLNGSISGWNPNVPPPLPPATTSTQAILGVPPASGSSYTGLAMAVRGTDRFLYAANNTAGQIDVFDRNFASVSLPGSFADPNLPAGASPFNIVNMGGNLFVTYSGPVGVVNVFDPDGNFVKRFATDGSLHNPWGMTVAPADFGIFGGALLVGNFNFGDPSTGPGAISAFDAGTGDFLGLLKDANGDNLSIDGLWSLTFGNGAQGGAVNTLYFTAGIEKETHGLFGSLSACHAPVLSRTSISPSVLWPPNHQFVPVTVNYEAVDDCDPTPVCTLSVTSNEGDGGGSGNSSPDWQVIDAHHVELRAERAGTGEGRVYTITASCSDKVGFSKDAAFTVTVPHDNGKRSKP
ncbi:MAG: TIGR03118 family protein [Bryobacterales bacterium]|nr:TIGR03118 family protein [Bryobacterales bacterium]